MIRTLGVFIFLIVITSIAEAQRDFAQCEITNEQDCNYAYLENNLPGGKIGWIVKPGGDTKCLDGSPYSFQVFLGDTNKLMLWFQGGGACFNYETCLNLPFIKKKFSVEKNGIMDMNLNGNPLANGGWTTVVNNMCTGDMFIGDAKVDVNDPNGMKKSTVYYNGYKNTLSVLNWIESQPEFQPGQEMTAGGCGTGSFGVQAWAHMLVKIYGFDKFQLDSSIAFYPSRSNVILDRWDACTVYLKLELSDEIVQQCQNKQRNSLSEVFESFLESHTRFPVAYNGMINDMTQIRDYALFSNPDYSGDPQELVAALAVAQSTFTRYLWNTLLMYKELDVNFSDYVVEGSDSCFLSAKDIASNPDYESPYTPRSMLQFFGDFLNRDITNGSPNYPEGFPYDIPDEDDDLPDDFRSLIM